MSNTISRLAVGELTVHAEAANPVKVGEFTLGATMTISPEAAAESGFITVDIGGTLYQIPVYAA